jgi:hypothetical protein
MLGIVIALLCGGFVGVCIGAWLVADNVRHSPNGCLACGRPWHHTRHLPDDLHVQVIERAPNVRPFPALPPTSEEDPNE